MSTTNKNKAWKKSYKQYQRDNGNQYEDGLFQFLSYGETEEDCWESALLGALGYLQELIDNGKTLDELPEDLYNLVLNQFKKYEGINVEDCITEEEAKENEFLEGDIKRLEYINLSNIQFGEWSELKGKQSLLDKYDYEEMQDWYLEQIQDFIEDIYEGKE